MMPEIMQIKGHTHAFTSPEDWDNEKEPCRTLYIKEVETDQGQFFISEWKLSNDEIAMLLKGQTIKLWIRGPGHPVVALSVGELPE